MPTNCKVETSESKSSKNFAANEKEKKAKEDAENKKKTELVKQKAETE